MVVLIYWYSGVNDKLKNAGQNQILFLEKQMMIGMSEREQAG